MEVSGGGRRRRSLSDENFGSPDTGGGDGGQTLAAVLSQKRPPLESAASGNRTLFDVIRDDGATHHHRKTWRTFKDKIRLRRAGAAWTSSVHVPASDVPIPSSRRTMSRRHSTRFPPSDPDPTTAVSSSTTQLSSAPSGRAMMMARHNSSRLPNLATASYGRGSEFSTSFGAAARADDRSDSEEEEREDDDEKERERESESEEEEEEGEVRMSLMALLAETDRQMGLDGSPFMIGDDEDDDDDDEEEEAGPGAGEYNNCCVCMVRHKGAAFIPCGHTFCRLCSRELYVQRGNCPLCNNFILEILDIF